jgi:hypothetical protein
VPSHCRTINLLSLGQRQPLSGRERLRLAGNEGAAGLSRFVGESTAPFGPQRVELRQLDDAQRWAGDHRVERVALYRDRAPAVAILLQRRLDHRAALEDEPLRSPDHTVNDRAFEQLPTGPDHHPAKPSQPAPQMEGFQKPLNVCTVPDRESRH